MSMLTAQADELRKMAEEIDGLNFVNISTPWAHKHLVPMLREAADTILDMRDRLQGYVNGSTSDGYHTFDELYHHRAVLFSVIVAQNRERAWKSKLHHDGTMYDGMFIVGLDTPWGQASYHYDIDPYWDMFDCEEREAAPEWDGHTPDDAIERIGKLATLGRGTCKITDNGTWGYPYVCSACGASFDADVNNGDFNYCPNCGRRVSE